ncbi:MAG: hemerythrin domain-containing protein, partial [Acidimicrobiales bacterium]
AGIAGGLLVGRLRRRRLHPPAATHELDPRAIEPSANPDDAFVVLRRAHDELRAMADDVKDRPAGSRQQAHEATEAMHGWVAACVKHETAEEAELWPVVRQRLEGGDGLAQRAGEAELELRRLLQTLSRRFAGDVDWDELIDTIGRLAYDHMVFEQVQVFAPLSRVLSDRERSELGRRLRAAAEQAPARPHLATSGSRRLSRLVSVVDRARS